jgi:hypothetical protein
MVIDFRGIFFTWSARVPDSAMMDERYFFTAEKKKEEGKKKHERKGTVAAGWQGNNARAWPLCWTREDLPPVRVQ